MVHKVFNDYSHYKINYPETVDVIQESLESTRNLTLNNLIDSQADKLSSAIIADVPCYDLELCDEKFHAVLSEFMADRCHDYQLRDVVSKLLLKEFEETLVDMFNEVQRKHEEDLSEGMKLTWQNIDKAASRNLNW